MSALSPVISHEPTSWRRLAEVADLAEIYEPGVQVCSWQRSIDPLITTYLSGIAHYGKLQFIETLESGHSATLDALPEGEGRQLLVEDLALLAEVFCDLSGCPAVGLRGARIENAMCPKWHIDRVPVRLLCTYEGPGTEWLDDQSVPRSALSEQTDGAFQQATTGEVVLLKGALWQDNEKQGAIHRSPSMETGQRTVVSLDPLWRD